MKIQKCEMSDLEAVSALYDKVTFHLTKTINYPKWRYGEYPCTDSVK